MRLIDADALIEEANADGAYGYVDAKQIADAPTVDAVEIVRCRECKYHNKPPCPMRLSFNWTEDDDFCSYGERKEGADNG
jgi:hypothetical protein